MRSTLQEVSKTQLGELLTERMEELGLSIRDISMRTDVTYEHVRRVIRGEGSPSKYVLKLICDELGVPYKEADRLSTADKIKKKFGNIPAEISGKNPELEPVERAWTHLTQQQKDSIITMARAWSQQNKAAKVGL